MAMVDKISTEINLAVYMERLDGYIASQTALNNTLVEGLERVQNQISDIDYWRNRIKSGRKFLRR